MEVQSPHIILTDCGEAWTIVICWVSMRNLTSTSFLDITQKGVRLLTWSTRIFFLRGLAGALSSESFLFCVEQAGY